MSSNKSCRITPEMENAIKMIGDSWMLSIIGNLSDGPLRFCEIERAVTGINPVTLTSRLKKLEQEKIIIRQEETLDKVSVVYELTEKGRGVVPVVTAIGKFAEKYV